MTALQRLAAAWNAFRGRHSAESIAARERTLDLERRLAERDMDIRELQASIEGLKTRSVELEASLAQRRDDPFGDLVSRLAAPLSQLRMQRALIDAGREITAANVFAVAGRIVDAIEETGLEPIYSPGEEISFDPALCAPVGAAASYAAGDAVVVRFNGYRYNGRVIRKALVEAKE